MDLIRNRLWVNTDCESIRWDTTVQWRRRGGGGGGWYESCNWTLLRNLSHQSLGHRLQCLRWWTHVQLITWALPSSEDFYEWILNTIRCCCCGCSNPKTVACIWGVVIAQDGQRCSHFFNENLLCQQAPIAQSEQGAWLFPPNCQIGQQGCHRTQVFISSAQVNIHSLPQLVCLWPAQVDPHQRRVVVVIHSHIPNRHTINRPLVGNCGWRQFSHSEKTKEGCAAGGPQHNDVEVCGLSCPQGFQLSQYVRGDWEARFAGWLWPQTLNSPLNQRQLWHGFCSWLWQIPWNLQMSDGS